MAYHTMIASALAISEYRKVGDGKIGIILNLTPSYPRSEHPADVKASNIADLFFNRSFLDPSVLGEYPQERCGKAGMPAMKQSSSLFFIPVYVYLNCAVSI